MDSARRCFEMAEKTLELFDCGHRACGGCGSGTCGTHRYESGWHRHDRGRGNGCMEVFSTPYPETAWKVPWIHSLFENASAVASGVEAALKKQGRTEKVVIMAGDGANL